MACLLLPAVWPMAPFVIYILVITNALTAITNMLINFCFIKGIFSKERLITPTNLFVVSLAVSDFLVGLISQPLMCVHLLLNRWTVRSCAIAHSSYFALGIFCGVSGMMLPVISLDRYIRMRKLQYYSRYVTKKRVIIVILALWVNALGLAFSPLYGIPRHIFYSVLLAYLFVISIVMSIAYASVIIRSTRSRVNIRPITTQQAPTSATMNSATVTAATSSGVSVSDSEQRPAADTSRQLRITITVAILVAVVIVSWIPCFILGLIWSLGIPASDKDSTIVTMRYVTITIGFVSSSINPLLYCWRIRDARKAAMDVFRNMLTC